ncbi:MAG: SEC-C domain-containing protein [Proteobacteria bacterium]|nr:SEC-C domain-containing protein [Pseudomonadota bacterium]
MSQVGRNDPCPCGSGKKFKRCHMGREEELVLMRLGDLPDGAAEKIMTLPEVDYGRCREMLDRLDVGKLTRTNVQVRFVDLGAYLEMGYTPRDTPGDLNRTSAGQMINPLKTLSLDPDHIYLAVSPAVSESTLIHQLAHALDFLAGSRTNPALARPLSMETEAPLELLEHPREFGHWLAFLANEFGVILDAEDAIVGYLFENGRLIPGEIIGSGDAEAIRKESRAIIEFISQHREEIDERIKGRGGYIEPQKQ